VDRDGAPIRDAAREVVKRRLVRFGERFDSDELARNEVELEEVPPAPEPPEDEQAEPWGLAEDAPPEKHAKFGHRLREYVAAHRHPGDEEG
jgi:hypothetical protein